MRNTHMGTRSLSSSSTSVRAYIRSAMEASKLDSRTGATRIGGCTHARTCARGRLGADTPGGRLSMRARQGSYRDLALLAPASRSTCASRS